MLQRGRKSTQSLAVVTPLQTVQRLSPPATLSEDQRQVWLETVNNRPADWFGAEQVPLLECYCGHMAYARMLRQVLDRVDPKWLLDEDGLKQHNKLFAMHARETAAAANLATKLRLTSQAVTDKRVAGRASDRFKSDTLKPWQLEGESSSTASE